MTCTNKYFVENSLTFCTTMGQQPYFSVDNARDLPLSESHITHESPSSEIFPFLQGPQSCVTSVRVFSNFLCHTQIVLSKCSRVTSLGVSSHGSVNGDKIVYRDLGNYLLRKSWIKFKLFIGIWRSNHNLWICEEVLPDWRDKEPAHQSPSGSQRQGPGWEDSGELRSNA